MSRILGLVLAVVVTVALFYLSRFWEFRLWRGDLLGIAGLRAQGDLFAVWLRGTSLAPYALLLWAIGGFLCLSVLNWLWSKVFPPAP